MPKISKMTHIDNIIIWGWASILKVPKIASLQCVYNISEKKLEMKLIFCMQINKFPKSLFQHFGHQRFLQG